MVGNATLSLYVNSSINPGSFTCTQLIDVYSELNTWTEAGTSWNTLPGPYGTMGPTALGSASVTFDGQSDYPARYVSWTIPGSVVQSWINNPAGNNGLVLVSQTTAYFEDLLFLQPRGWFRALLDFSTSAPLTWTGSSNGSWSLAGSDVNWSGPATAYSDGAAVLFSDWRRTTISQSPAAESNLPASHSRTPPPLTAFPAERSRAQPRSP